MHTGKSIAVGLLALGMTSCLPEVHYSPAVAGRVARPKAPSCRIEFFRSKSPERPFEELGGLFVEGSTDPEDLQDALGRKACEQGADAVLITRDYTPAMGKAPASMTGTAIRYREEGAAAGAASSDPCRLSFTVGKWSLCQVPGSAVYVWWTAEGEEVAAKFPINGTGAWFVRRAGKTIKVESHDCHGENNPTCGQTTQETAPGESWEQPVMASSPVLAETVTFTLGKIHFELSAKHVLVGLPDEHTVVFPAERARIEMGLRGIQRQGLWPASPEGTTAVEPKKVSPNAVSPEACTASYEIGKWSLCQVASSAVYVWWTGQGVEVAAKFPADGKGPWFIRRDGKTTKVQGHSCRGENSPTCGLTTQDPAAGEVWEQPSITNGPAAEEGTSFVLGKTRFELSPKEILIRLPDNQTVGIPADRPSVTMGLWNGPRSEIKAGLVNGGGFFN